MKQTSSTIKSLVFCLLVYYVKAEIIFIIPYNHDYNFVPLNGSPIVRANYTTSLLHFLSTLLALLTLVLTITITTFVFKMKRQLQRLLPPVLFSSTPWSLHVRESKPLKKFLDCLQVSMKTVENEREEFAKKNEPTVSKSTSLILNQQMNDVNKNMKITENNQSKIFQATNGDQDLQMDNTKIKKLEEAEGYETLDGLDGMNLDTKRSNRISDMHTAKAKDAQSS
ncbi:hypothetical protein M3Y98_00038100 [Aphelenchoides besseyi]|nr:hypothetical protein M3Y98_00038100 [Aphelenchoides besseyi]KAI6199068.1 hypothetical protein M3Y96_00587300 [Aphelenchoides besseyi]